MRFTITRSKWHRGGPGSALLLRTGKQCCVGQMCSQLGIPDSKLIEMGGVDSLLRYRHVSKDELGPLCDSRRDAGGAAWLDTAYMINDGLMDDDFREKRLADLAAEHGHELVFVD